MWEEGVVRSNTTEARLINRTTFYRVSHGNEKLRNHHVGAAINWPLEPNSGIIVPAAPIKIQDERKNFKKKLPQGQTADAGPPTPRSLKLNWRGG